MLRHFELTAIGSRKAFSEEQQIKGKHTQGEFIFKACILNLSKSTTALCKFEKGMRPYLPLPTNILEECSLRYSSDELYFTSYFFIKLIPRWTATNLFDTFLDRNFSYAAVLLTKNLELLSILP